MSGLFFFLAVLIPAPAYSADYQINTTQTVLEALANEPVWLRLLHWDLQEREQGSDIRSADFFLTGQGDLSPLTELRATLDGLYRDGASPPDDPNQSTQCRYPARFLWLSQELSLDVPIIECTRLQAWAKFEQLDSVSLMLISGYFGNPASTFGHILLKINNGSIPVEHSLFDLGINYGALVPQDEPTFVYVLRGLFGGYEAGFSDQDFYRFDQTYSRTEFRDMWEYELRLNDFQRRMLLFHLWEISGKKFRYFFVKSNCAYRLAELLELLSGENFVQDVDLWYAPVSVFHRLQQIDAARPSDNKLIKSVTYVPSARRIFQAHVDYLDRAQQDSLARYIEMGEIPSDESVGNTRVLDTLLRYYEYKLAAIPEEEGGEIRAQKNAAVLRRLQLPAASHSERPAIDNRRSPARGSAPSQISFGGGDNEVTGKYMYLSYAPFRYDSIGNNSLQGSSLTVVDIAASASSGGRAKLEYFDLFRARKVNLNRLAFLGESALSWEVAGGARQESNGCDRCIEAFAAGHAGRVLLTTGHLKFLLMGGATIASHGSSIDASATVVFGEESSIGAELRSEYRYFPSRHRGRTAHALAARLSLSQNTELRLEISEIDATDGRLIFAYHF